VCFAGYCFLLIMLFHVNAKGMSMHEAEHSISNLHVYVL
jgi:hypothetical protein